MQLFSGIVQTYLQEYVGGGGGGEESEGMFLIKIFSKQGNLLKTK